MINCGRIAGVQPPKFSQLSPHHAERVELKGPYGPLAALRLDAVDARAIVLLVPGYTGSKEDFAPLLDPLADAGFTVVAIDLPGQFESPGPAQPQAYRPQALGEVVAEVIAELGEEGVPVLLHGHSYGGLVARAAVLAGAHIVGLTLQNSGPERLTEPNRVAVMELAEPILREHGVEVTWQLRLEMLKRNPDFAAIPDEIIDFNRRRFTGSTPAGLIGMSEGLRFAEDLVSSLARRLDKQGTPCLVVCGEHDDAWSPHSQRDMAERLDADFALLPDCGHSPNTENPGALLDTLISTWQAWLAH